MALKSVRIFKSGKKMKRKVFKNGRSIGRILVGGAGILIGLAAFKSVQGSINS